MFSKKWKSFLGGGGSATAVSTARPPSSSSVSGSLGPVFIPNKNGQDEFVQRSSSGLAQFFDAIQDQAGLSILDLGGASQSNISYITSLGHRVYSEDLVKSLHLAFPDGDQTNPEGIERFLANSFQFRDFEFDGALAWDSLQILQPPLLQIVIDRLFHTLRPQAILLSLFHADEKADYVPLHAYRIANRGAVQIALRGQHRAGQHFNNRSLERLFQKYHQVKFFLTRDSLREVLIRR